MTDILKQIDESIARNAARFDPFGPDCRGDPGKSGSEEESEPVEAAFELTDRGNLPENAVLNAATGAVTWTQNSSPAPAVYPRLSSRYGPPATDRVAEAFRAEVRRQGLAPCEIDIDGQPEMLGAEPSFTVIDETHTFRRAWLNDRVEEIRSTFTPGDGIDVTGLGDPMQFVVTSVASDGTAEVESVPSPVDAASEPDAYEPFVADENWREEPAPIPDKSRWPWWRRMFPGGTR